MKKVFFVFLLAGAMSSVNAQVQFGPKAGANFSNFSGSDASGAKMQVGFYGGGFARLSITDNIKIQPELLFSGQGSKYEENIEGQLLKYNTHLNYISVPVMVQYHAGSGFYGETGPQISLLMSAKAKGSGETLDIKDSYKKSEFAWGFGLGYQLSNGIGINARYILGLSKLDEAGEANVKNTNIQVGLFYSIGGGSK